MSSLQLSQRVMYHRNANHSLKKRVRKMKIAIASDHAGYEEKERLKPLLDELGVQYEDLGTVSEESVDYPDYARKVGHEVASGHRKSDAIPARAREADWYRRKQRERLVDLVTVIIQQLPLEHRLHVRTLRRRIVGHNLPWERFAHASDDVVAVDTEDLS